MPYKYEPVLIVFQLYFGKWFICMYNTCIYIHFCTMLYKHVLLVLMKSGHISSYEQTKSMYFSPQFVHCELHVLSFSLDRVFFDDLEILFRRTDEK